MDDLDADMDLSMCWFRGFAHLEIPGFNFYHANEFKSTLCRAFGYPRNVYISF